MGSGAALLPFILADIGSRLGPEISAGLGGILPPAIKAGSLTPIETIPAGSLLPLSGEASGFTNALGEQPGLVEMIASKRPGTTGAAGFKIGEVTPEEIAFPVNAVNQPFPTQDVPQTFPRAGKFIGAGLGAGAGLLAASLLGETQDRQPRRVADSSGFRPTPFGEIKFPEFPSATIQSGDAATIAGSNRQAALLRILRQRRGLA